MKNVVLLTIDTLRQDVLGLYGNGLGLTPFIDSLQENCIRFSKAQSCGPYTQASFPAVLTSTYYLDYPRSEMLSRRRTLVSEPLQKAGIETAAFHSNAYLCEYFGWNRGWDTFYDSMELEVTDEVPYVKADILNQKVRSWLSSRRDRNAPFFLWLHYMDVHEPYVPEKKYVQAVDASINMTDKEMFQLFEEVLLKRDASNPETVALLKKLYLAHIRETDEAVKEFLGILEQAGVLNDTVVIITSDHGDEFGEHGGLSHDGKMYRELIDVPLLIYDPSLKSGQISDALVSTLDVSPTIVNLLGLDPVPGFSGQSLLPLKTLQSREVFGEAFYKHGNKEDNDPKQVFYCRWDDIKMIYSENDDSWQLYDLDKDPREQNNLVESHPDAEELKRRILPRVRRHVSV